MPGGARNTSSSESNTLWGDSQDAIDAAGGGIHGGDDVLNDRGNTFNKLYGDSDLAFAYGYALHMCHPDDTQIVQEALEHAKRGMKLASDREKPYLLMGRLCKAIGRPGAAEKMFTRAVQIQPDCVEALRELRLINMRRHRSKGLIGRLLGR